MTLLPVVHAVVVVAYTGKPWQFDPVLTLDLIWCLHFAAHCVKLCQDMVLPAVQSR